MDTDVNQGADLLGRTLDPAEADIVEVHRRLRALVDRDDLPPCAAANLRQALACSATVVNDLALEYEHLLDRGV